MNNVLISINSLSDILDELNIDKLIQLRDKIKKQLSDHYVEFKTKKSSSKDTYETEINKSFVLYSNVIELYNSLSEELDNKSLNDMNEMSKLKAKYSLVKNNTDLILFTNEMSDKLISYIDVENIEDIKYLQSIVRKHIFSVSLYANILQKIVDDSSSKIMSKSNTNLLSEIFEIIESDKSFFLLGHATNIFKKKVDNPPMKRFGLVPITDSMSLSELMHVVIGKKNINKISNLSSIKNYGFIIFNHIVYTPIEYNIRSLIVPSVAAKLIQPDTYGPTLKTVERFKTIRDYPAAKWDFDHKIINESSDKIIIIETLEGKSYRCLAPWVDSALYGYFINKEKVLPIIEYIKNKNVSDRVSNYHIISTKLATKNMFLKKPIAMESFEENSADVPSHIIKQEIILNLETHVNKYKSIKDSVQLNEVLHDEGLRDIFYNTTLRLYPKAVILDSIKEFKADRFPFSELLSSFIVELQNITGKFMRELHDGYGRKPLPKETFDLPADERNNIIRKKISTVIEDALNLVIKNESNIYSTLHYKFLLLNIQ
jgi:hypothetical protein